MSANDDGDVALIFWQWLLLQDEKSPTRHWWVHPINKKRTGEKTLQSFLQELRADEKKFKNFTRMSSSSFDHLLEIISNRIEKKNTNWRPSIPPDERLLITLRFLATGERFQSLHYYFRVGATTIGKIVIETCRAIWDELFPIYMKRPTTDTWLAVADKFEKIWNFPNCIGSIDGKHIRIQCPINSGSAYRNYKHFNSIILQAVANADAEFISVDVGDFGRNSDSGVFMKSNFGKSFLKNDLSIPQPRRISNDNPTILPYVFVGDEAYPLSKNLMRPFSRHNLTPEKRIYNYRHSRARRIVECAFGLLTKRFRVFETTMLLSPEHAETITLACCVLHNMLLRREHNISDIHEELLLLQEEEERNNTQEQTNWRRASNAALAIRNSFVDYFNSPEGSVPWQNKFALINQ